LDTANTSIALDIKIDENLMKLPHDYRITFGISYLRHRLRIIA